jgi:hypothetical protein
MKRACNHDEYLLFNEVETKDLCRVRYYETKAFYFAASKFAGLQDHHACIS